MVIIHVQFLHQRFVLGMKSLLVHVSFSFFHFLSSIKDIIYVFCGSVPCLSVYPLYDNYVPYFVPVLQISYMQNYGLDCIVFNVYCIRVVQLKQVHRCPPSLLLLLNHIYMEATLIIKNVKSDVQLHKVVSNKQKLGCIFILSQFNVQLILNDLNIYVSKMTSELLLIPLKKKKKKLGLL